MAAKAAGFDAVECHWPYAVPADEVRTALDETDLPLLGLNTVRGDVAAGENGLAALPGREAEARAAIDQALAYAAPVGARAVHVMAGFSGGPRAHAAFAANLRHACAAAAPLGITILIEPLNHYDAPGYFLATSTQAAALIRELAMPNLKLMFDCYHLQIMEGDLTRRLTALLPIIGHVQMPPSRTAVRRTTASWTTTTSWRTSTTSAGTPRSGLSTGPAKTPTRRSTGSRRREAARQVRVGSAVGVPLSELRQAVPVAGSLVGPSDTLFGMTVVVSVTG
jgi:hydroxypyruvate isomerase